MTSTPSLALRSTAALPSGVRSLACVLFFFFNDTATPEIYPLPLHDALPILLATAFVRLALTPAVLSYHARSATPILNWYLYTYGLVTLSLFTGARLLAPPRDRVLTIKAPAMLYTMGTVLGFLLVNIQIADFFAEPGTAALTFKFSGNFTRDMTYSIAWALFALVLLLPGLVKGITPARYAALALLGVTLLKLFLHDLAKLAQLYRVGALV